MKGELMNSPSFKPLGHKIVTAVLGITLLALVLSFLLNIIPMIYGYRQDAMERTLSCGKLLGASLAPSLDFHDPEAAREDLGTLSLTPLVTGAAVYLEDGTEFATYGIPPNRPLSLEPGTHFSVSSLEVIMPIQSAQPGSIVVIKSTLMEQWHILQGYAFFGTVIFLGVFFFCVKIAGNIRRRLGDPLQELTSVVKDISDSRDFSRRVNYESNDELGVLVAEFNAMLQRIEDRDAQLQEHSDMLEQRVEERTLQLKANQLELLQNNRQLFMEIRRRAQAEMIREEVERINRHDLKSGLSLVIGYPELLLKEGGLNERQEKLIKRIRNAGYRMLDMIRNHLDMFKMEKGVYSLSRSPIDLIEILCELEEEFFPLLSRNNVKLLLKLDGKEIVGDEAFIISGEGPLMRTLCRNLLQNAIEASADGDVVTVSLENAERKHLIVANPTPVPQKIRERFFEKYVTSGKENGTGLGTYIAALIAKTHGADIAMKTNDEIGTIMQVTFRNYVDKAGKMRRPLLPVDKRNLPN